MTTADHSPNIHPSDPRIAVPLYTMRQVSQFLAVPRSTLIRWHPFISHMEVSQRQQPNWPFIGLVEAYVLDVFRKAGVPFQRIRPALTMLTQTIGLEHALASRKLYTDGAEILYEWSTHDDITSQESIARLVIVRNGQQVFRDIVAQYLQRIIWGEDGYPLMLQLPLYRQARILADPARAFGQPIFAQSATKVADVLQRFGAGDALTSIADDYGLSFAEVENVVRVASSRAS